MKRPWHHEPHSASTASPQSRLAYQIFRWRVGLFRESTLPDRTLPASPVRRTSCATTSRRSVSTMLSRMRSQARCDASNCCIKGSGSDAVENHGAGSRRLTRSPGPVPTEWMNQSALMSNLRLSASRARRRLRRDADSMRAVAL